MKALITTFLLFSTFSLISQDAISKFDVRVGVGLTSNNSLSAPHVLQSEVNYRFNNYIAVTGGLNFGKKLDGTFLESFRQWNLNAFLSPLKNNKRHDIRIGGGLSSMNHTIIDVDRIVLVTATPPIESDNLFSEEGISLGVNTNSEARQIGTNAIIEYTFRINDKFSIGASHQYQSFSDEWYRTATMVKIGIAL